MSDLTIQEELNNDLTTIEESNNDNENKENEQIDLKPGKTQRSDKTKFERTKDAKQRAIDNFKRGVLDPEYRVVKMSNEKYRCYKRKDSLPPSPINVNQIPPNLPSSQIEGNIDLSIEPKKPKIKEHDPFQDIVWYNMSNQISEQLNKRLDAVNVELERLRNKNSKLKSKYKQLKQAIYITEEEEVSEKPVPQPIPQPIPQPVQQIESPILRPLQRTNGINFNRFFN